jgi:hypothetical protein
MGKAIYRVLSNEEALRKYGTGTFVFVGGSGLVPDKTTDDTEAQSQESPPENREKQDEDEKRP